MHSEQLAGLVRCPSVSIASTYITAPKVALLGSAMLLKDAAFPVIAPSLTRYSRH